MAVHRMDFLVASHQDQLLREAREQHLRASIGHPEAASGQAGGIRLARLHLAVHLALHDVHSHRLHRHHLGHHA